MLNLLTESCTPNPQESCAHPTSTAECGHLVCVGCGTEIGPYLGHECNACHARRTGFNFQEAMRAMYVEADKWEAQRYRRFTCVRCSHVWQGWTGQSQPFSNSCAKCAHRRFYEYVPIVGSTRRVKVQTNSAAHE
jgi:hypothetical protein